MLMLLLLEIICEVIGLAVIVAVVSIGLSMWLDRKSD